MVYKNGSGTFLEQSWDYVYKDLFREDDYAFMVLGKWFMMLVKWFMVLGKRFMLICRRCMMLRKCVWFMLMCRRFMMLRKRVWFMVPGKWSILLFFLIEFHI